MDRLDNDKPSPEHFPLGSAQSRAAARVELDRRQRTMQETADAYVDRVAPPLSTSEERDAKEPEPMIAAPVESSVANRPGEAVEIPDVPYEQTPSAVARRSGQTVRVSGFAQRRRLRWGTPLQQA